MVTPTPVTFAVPTTGIFRASGDFGSALYIQTPNGIESLNLLDPKWGLYTQGTVGSGNQAQQALQTLKTRYGIDFNALPQFNVADNPPKRAFSGDIASLVSNPQAGTTTRTVNGPEAQAEIAAHPPVAPGTTPQAAGTQAATPPTGSQTSQTGSTSAASQAAISPPIGVQLGPGSKGPEVEQLQKWLISQGYAIPALQNGTAQYGTFADQTKAALTQWQKDHGVQTSGNDGFWGPASQKTFQSLPTQKTTGQTSTSAQGDTNAAGTGLVFNENYSVTPDQWNQMNDTQRAMIAAAYTAKQQAYQTDGQQLTFADALDNAAKDPNILASFSDAAKLDAATFQQSIQQLQQASTLSSEDQQRQFETDRKQLAEAYAAHGAAQSGFRGAAQKQLGEQEAGIVTSSRAQLQKQLNDLTQQFTSKYGSAATTPATANFQNPYQQSNYTLSGLYSPSGGANNSLLTGLPLAGVTGTQVPAQEAAIHTKAQQLYDEANAVPKLS